MGSDDALISSEGSRRFDGVQALGEARLLHVHGGHESRVSQGGPPGQWCRCEGGPAAQKVTENARIFVLQPVQHLRDIVLQGPGAAMGDPHCIPDHAAPVCDERFEGAHGRTLRLERLQRVAMGEEECELACGMRGVVCGPARRKGFTVPRQRQWMDREKDEKVIRA